jgi:hypothetical protein
VLDFSHKFCYYYIVPRGERIALLLHKNQSRVREILKKKISNPLEKPLDITPQTWYNEYVKRKDTSQTRKGITYEESHF